MSFHNHSEAIRGPSNVAQRTLRSLVGSFVVLFAGEQSQKGLSGKDANPLVFPEPLEVLILGDDVLSLSRRGAG